MCLVCISSPVLFVTQCSEANDSRAPARQRCSSEISDRFRSVLNCHSPSLGHVKPEQHTLLPACATANCVWMSHFFGWLGVFI